MQGRGRGSGGGGEGRGEVERVCRREGVFQRVSGAGVCVCVGGREGGSESGAEAQGGG